MASSAVANLLRSTAAPLIRSLSPASVPRLSISQAAFGRVSVPGYTTRFVRLVANAATGHENSHQQEGRGDESRANSEAGETSELANSQEQRNSTERGQGYGMTRRRRGGDAISPFSFDLGPLFSARGDRDLLTMMDDFFLTPSRFFDDAIRDVMQNADSALASGIPRLDINQTDTEFKIEMALPGLRKDEMSITVEECPQPVLHITARHEPKEGDQTRFWQDVDTRLRLPEGTDPDHVDAEFKDQDGELIIRVPKNPDVLKKPEPKRIQIKGAD